MAYQAVFNLMLDLFAERDELPETNNAALKKKANANAKVRS